jgi:Family of unknown function (DUF5681)
MASYEIGYGKPPVSGRFCPGVSGNPKGRPKRKPTPLAERIKSALNAPIKYRERGRTKVATYRELSLKMLVDHAISGDLDAAELALSILDRAERYSDPSLAQFWSKTGWPIVPVKPPTRRPPTLPPGATLHPPNGGGRPTVDRKGPVHVVDSSDSPRASHFPRAAASGSVKGPLGPAASSFQGASLRTAVRQDVDRAGTCARGGMRLVRSPAYDLVRSAFGSRANAPADPRFKLADASCDPSLEWRPHRLLVVGESNRGPRSAISTHCG